MAFSARAEVVKTDISGYANIVYADEAFLNDDLSSATLTLNLKNDGGISGIQFFMVLPEGVEIDSSAAEDGSVNYMIKTIQNRLSDAPNPSSARNEERGEYRVVYLNTAGQSFRDTDGPVFSVSLNIDRNVAPGDYPITITEQVISYAAGTTAADIKDPIVSVLHVAVPEYDDGYSLSLEPVLEFDPEETVTPITLDCSTDITNVEFDVLLPQLWIQEELYYSDNGKATGKTKFNVVADGSDDNTFVHFAIAAKKSSYMIAASSGAEIAKLGITDGDSKIEAGVYTIQILNIQLTDISGNIKKVVPSTSYVKVGEPAASSDATVAFVGSVSSDVISSIMEDSSVGIVDMSAVTSIDGTLKLADNKKIIAPKYEAPVEKVEYSREMPEKTAGVNAKYGTICVPFALQSNSDIQYYKLSAVSESAMTFTEIATLEAGTPALFKVLTGEDVGISETDVTLKGGSMLKNETVSGASWTMKGTYSDIDVDPTGKSIYYINSDKFYSANMSFKVPSYRAWFETSPALGAPVRAIMLDSDNNVTDVDFVECGDGMVQVIFNLSGQQVTVPQSGEMYIINGQKFIEE